MTITDVKKQILKTKIEQVHRSPQNADAWEALADFLAENGEEKKAAQCYRKVLNLRPDDLEAQINLERLTDEVPPETLLQEIKSVINQDALREIHIPPLIQVLFALISFLITLLMAEVQQWQITDLVWSLWITSLVLGYGYLITGIATAAIQGSLLTSLSKKNAPLQETPHIPAVGVILAALFMVAFFTVHFGMFHYVHSVFLNLFFPLVGEGMGFVNPVMVIGICLRNYWSIILLSALTQLPNFLDLVNHPQQDFMSMPYKNVVKMHLSIFVFAGLSFTKFNGIGLYYLLILYFFPFAAIKMLFSPKQNKEEIIQN